MAAIKSISSVFLPIILLWSIFPQFGVYSRTKPALQTSETSKYWGWDSRQAYFDNWPRSVHEASPALAARLGPSSGHEPHFALLETYKHAVSNRASQVPILVLLTQDVVDKCTKGCLRAAPVIWLCLEKTDLVVGAFPGERVAIPAWIPLGFCLPAII